MSHILNHVNYQVSPTAEGTVTLQITIGYAQLGSTAVSVGGVRCTAAAVNSIGETIYPDAAKNYTGSFIVPLGKNKDVAGKTLTIFAPVEQIQPDTDPNGKNLSYGITLRGGTTDASYTLTETSAGQGNIIDFTAVIVFTA